VCEKSSILLHSGFIKKKANTVSVSAILPRLFKLLNNSSPLKLNKMRKFMHTIVFKIKNLKLSDFKIQLELGSAPDETTWR